MFHNNIDYMKWDSSESNNIVTQIKCDCDCGYRSLNPSLRQQNNVNNYVIIIQFKNQIVNNDLK